jgi:O-antigen/teichoic acid export membrane protein
VSKSIGSNWILNLLQILVLMKLTPYVVGRLGLDLNGLWVTIVSITGFLSLLILGVPMASVRFIAEHVAKKDLARANASIATSLAICACAGAAAVLAGGALYLFFERVHLAALSPAAVEDARLAFAIVVLHVAIGFVMRLPYAVFDAHHDFVARNYVMAGELALRLGLTLLALELDAALRTLALVQVVCLVAEFTAALLLLRRRHPGIRFGFRGFDRAIVRPVLSFTVFATLLNVGSMLAFRADAIVIGAFRAPADVTFFDIGNKFFDPLTSFVLGIGVVVMPAATRLQATGATGELVDVLLKWSKICFSLVLMIGLYLIVLGPDFLAWWVGPEFAEPSGRVLQVLMLSFLLFLPVRGVALPILMGLGKPVAPALALLAMGALNLGLSLALVGPLGILGVALGTAIPNALFACAVLAIACKELGARPADYLRYVAGRPVIGALPPLALLLWMKHGLGVEGFVPLLVAGLAFVAAYALCWATYVYRDDRYVDLSGRLTRALQLASRGRTP